MNRGPGPRSPRARWQALRSLLGAAYYRLRFRLLERHRHRRLVSEVVDGFDLVILPDVFHPTLFHSSTLLAAAAMDHLRATTGARVLDLGTGSGYLALVAAREGGVVIATDVALSAVRCARMNLERAVQRAQIPSPVEVRPGDLFEPVRGERFDLVLWNPPYFEGAPRDDWERSWRDDTGARARFCAELASHLTPTGVALVVDSDRARPSITPHVSAAGFRRREVALRALATGERLSVLALDRPGS